MAPRRENRNVDIPPRSAPTAHLVRCENGLDIAFDIDLGELMPGHHVIARGIEREKSIEIPSRRWLEERQKEALGNRDPMTVGYVRVVGPPPGPADMEVVEVEDELHFEHVPGLTMDSPTPDWEISARDDVGTIYNENHTGAFDGSSGGASTHGIRDLGGRIPREATRLVITIEPAEEWVPPDPWRRELILDLRQGVVIE